MTLDLVTKRELSVSDRESNLNPPVAHPRNLVTQLTDVHSFHIMLVCASYVGIKLFSIYFFILLKIALVIQFQGSMNCAQAASRGPHTDVNYSLSFNYALVLKAANIGSKVAN